jgi:hypothetical protein
MNIEQLSEWRAELIICGDIVQDEDNTVPQKVAEERFNRYIEMLESVEGNEGEGVFNAIIDSITPREDYGSFERVLGTLNKFSSVDRGQYLARSIVKLIKKSREKAINLLFNALWEEGEDLKAFNGAWSNLAEGDIELLLEFVVENEKPGEYLDEMKGKLRPTAHI